MMKGTERLELRDVIYTALIGHFERVRKLPELTQIAASDATEAVLRVVEMAYKDISPQLRKEVRQMGVYIQPEQVAREEGFNSVEDYTDYVIYEDEPSVRACCSEGCMVEQSGSCPHGHPSILKVLGLI
jgi:hypothetical protein